MQRRDANLLALHFNGHTNPQKRDSKVQSKLNFTDLDFTHFLLLTNFLLHKKTKFYEKFDFTYLFCP